MVHIIYTAVLVLDGPEILGGQLKEGQLEQPVDNSPVVHVARVEGLQMTQKLESIFILLPFSQFFQFFGACWVVLQVI